MKNKQLAYNKLKNIKVHIFILLTLFSIKIVSAQGALTNPLKVDSVPELIGIIIKAVLGIVGSIALLMFIYGGFMWLTSGGNDEKIKEGRKTLVWSIIGLALIFASYAILKFVFQVLAK